MKTFQFQYDEYLVTITYGDAAMYGQYVGDFTMSIYDKDGEDVTDEIPNHEYIDIHQQSIYEIRDHQSFIDM